jgi:ketosteroid isomerase-like protein
MAYHRTGRNDVVAVFQKVAPKFSKCSPLSFELIAADISCDLAYTVGYEHSAVSIDGGLIVRNDLRVTHIYRREDGVWRLVHRHGGGGPRTQ